MKRLFLFTVLSFALKNVNAQNKYSLGLNAALYTSNSKKQAKKDLFLYNVAGTRIDFRKNTIGVNYLTISAESVINNKNIYSYQNLKFGYEVGNIFNIKNLFLTT
jgi:hypothetical protein